MIDEFSELNAEIFEFNSTLEVVVSSSQAGMSSSTQLLFASTEAIRRYKLDEQRMGKYVHRELGRSRDEVQLWASKIK